MRKIVYVLIVLVSVLSCSKDIDKPIDEITTEEQYYKSEVEQLLKAYKVEDVFKFDSSFRISKLLKENNDTTIFFSGRLKNSEKFGFIGFDADAKEKLFDLTQLEENSFTIDKGYGEKETHVISSIRVSNYCDNDLDNLVLSLYVSSDKSEASYIYFIDLNKVVKKIESSLENSYNNSIEISRWNDNFIIRPKSWYNNIKAFLYSPFGEIITEVLYRDYYINNNKVEHVEVIGDYEGVSVSFNNVVMFDLREAEPIWAANLDLNKLDKPRLDSAKLIEELDTHYIFELYYTEYSGKKVVLKIKVNIETRGIEYL